MFISKLPNNDGKKLILTRSLILQHISEEDIFLRYLGVFTLKKQIKSPLRNDKHSGCGFYHNGHDVIKYYDKAKNINEDCFGIVKLIYNCDYNKALNIIAEDFGLIDKDLSSVPYRDKIINNSQTLQRQTRLDFEPREFNKRDLDYWKRFNISLELLKEEKIYAVEKGYQTINGVQTLHYINTYNDPCYAYCFPDKTIKFYYPFRSKDKKRFDSMTDIYPISGYNKLPSVGDYVVITKSKKDEVCGKSFGIKNVVSAQQESGIINRDIIIDLYNRFDFLFLLFDWDLAGIKATRYNIIQYPFLKPLFIRDKGKDLSGYCDKYGVNKTQELVNNFKNYIKQFIYE